MQTPEEFAYEWGVSEMHQESIAKAIRARDAEIRRECAERAVRYFEDSGLGFEYDGMAITPNYDLLRATITGEEE